MSTYLFVYYLALLLIHFFLLCNKKGFHFCHSVVLKKRTFSFKLLSLNNKIKKIVSKKKGVIAKMDISDKEALMDMNTRSAVRNKNIHLSINNYTNILNREHINTKLIRSNVLSIFSYTLKYMNKKSLNKWLRKNIKATFYDTYIPRNKPLAYIRFKTYDDLRIFEKLIENKRFYSDDSLSLIKINRVYNKQNNNILRKKRKFNEENKLNYNMNDEKYEKNDVNNTYDDDIKFLSVNNDKYGEFQSYNNNNNDNNNNNNDINNYYDCTEGDRKKIKKDDLYNSSNNNNNNSKYNYNVMQKQNNDDKEFIDLQSIIKINKEEKFKSIENYVTPFYKYPYQEQIIIKHNFLKKCKDQILFNLKSKWMKQNILFGDMESNIINEEIDLNNIQDYYEQKQNKKNQTSKDNCINKTVLTDIKKSSSITRETSLNDKMKQYDIQVDEPLYPNYEGTIHYRNKCEFTISYDENQNVEIGFVVGKMKTCIKDDNLDKNSSEDNNCNFSENNISNNASPINETHSTKLRNKKQKQSYYLNPIVKNVDQCIHIHPAMKEVVQEMKSIIKESNLPVFDRVYKTGVWRLLVVRMNSKNELMITVQTYNLDCKKKKEIKRLLINRLSKNKDDTPKYFCNFKVLSIYIQEHESPNDSFDQSLNEHLWGMEYLEETILDNKFLLTPSCFFQVNRDSCQILYKRVIDYINIKEGVKNYIFDLCCGTGTISICASNVLKRNDVHIIGIDICESSIISANKNAKMNNINNYKFLHGRVEEFFSKEIKNIQTDNANIICIIDPPRNGIANSVLNILSAHHLINQIIYVSCNPITLIKNVTNILFLNETLKIKNMAFVDMFPHTFHLECITNIVKKA
ncbi:RNA (uracil-5-)methyltransferase, putative [Plasmodium gaboni]|uniref:RNA (Uracil-5-)methyltransferase, putative n=1 Tax=Plasmodium gaboni TaxID=647221 RepID=A0ABY1UQ79_9APIC|nr:RNA (uracil-5-)methyltransferase, putative [Plasmodium gaboni]